MATRSTSQIQEGPPGVSVAPIDGHCVSWRFKPLDQMWPFMLVTRPADRRLVTQANQTRRGALPVRAKKIGDAAVKAVETCVEDGGWMGMPPIAGEATIWQASVHGEGDRIRVGVRDARGRDDEDTVEPAPSDWTAPYRTAGGSDRHRIGAWPAKGLFGTQLGPDRHGRKW
jgi:hypothetical protein